MVSCSHVAVSHGEQLLHTLQLHGKAPVELVLLNKGEAQNRARMWGGVQGKGGAEGGSCCDVVYGLAC